jgi:hypothetical protein
MKITLTLLIISASLISRVSACTILTASEGETVLFGNNEDFSNPKTYYWVIPPSNDTYGGVYFGFDDLWPQGGVNEKGARAPNSKKFHWTYFLKVKDYCAWEEGFYKNIGSDYKRDIKILSHAVMDFYR